MIEKNSLCETNTNLCKKSGTILIHLGSQIPTLIIARNLHVKVVECVLWRREGAIKSTSKWLLVNIQGDFAGQGKQFSNVIFRQLQAVIITWVIGIHLPENTFSRYYFTFPQHANSCLAPRFSLIDLVFYRNLVPSLTCPLSLLLYVLLRIELNKEDNFWAFLWYLNKIFPNIEGY